MKECEAACLSNNQINCPVMPEEPWNRIDCCLGCVAEGQEYVGAGISGLEYCIPQAFYNVSPSGGCEKYIRGYLCG